MIALLVLGYVASCLLLLRATHASRRLVLTALTSLTVAVYGLIMFWQNAVFSVPAHDAIARRMIRTALTFEGLALLALLVSAACVIVAWRNVRHRRSSAGEVL